MYSRAIAKWEQAILGKKPLTLDENESIAKSEAKEITEYICYGLLGCKDGKSAARVMTRELAEKLLLDKVYKQVRFPIDLYRGDWGLRTAWILGVPLIADKLAIRYWQLVASRKTYMFPKGFFDGVDGIDRFSAILCHIIESRIQLPGDTDKEKVSALYRMFADQISTNKILKRFRLYDAYRVNYSSPLEALHYSLPQYLRQKELYERLEAK